MQAPPAVHVATDAPAAPSTSRVRNAGAFAVLAVALTVLFLLSLALPTTLTETPVWAGAVVLPLLVAVTVPFLAREAKRQGDHRLLWFLVSALLVKMLGALLRRWVALDLYDDRGDLTRYDRAGNELAEGFRAGSFDLEGRHFNSTEFIEIFTGIVYTLIGPSLMGGFFLYSWLAFMGMFMMYRAYVIALPDQPSKGYARLLFFLPSLVYWPSSIGKEAFMLFVLGIAALGTAKFVSGNILRGLPFVGIGLFLAAIVRPHVAVFAGMGLVAAALIRKPGKATKRILPFAKGVSLMFVGVIAVLLLARADAFLENANIDTQSVEGALGDVADRATTGGSEFTPPVLNSPSMVPAAVTTVLYRPFFFEAGNAQSLMAALEGSVLLVLSLIRLRSLWASARGIRRMPYLTFAWMYTILSIAALSTFGNFGILARQRTLLYPIFLVLLFIKPREKQRAVR